MHFILLTYHVVMNLVLGNKKSCNIYNVLKNKINCAAYNLCNRTTVDNAYGINKLLSIKRFYTTLQKKKKDLLHK